MPKSFNLEKTIPQSQLYWIVQSMYVILYSDPLRGSKQEKSIMVSSFLTLGENLLYF